MMEGNVPDDLLLEKILKRILWDGGDFADIFVERRKSSFIQLEGGRIEKAVTGFVAGIGVRLVKDRETAYACSNDFSEASLNELADTVRAAFNPSRCGNRDITFNLSRKYPVYLPVIKIFPDSVSMPERIEMLRRADGDARKVSGDIRQVNIIYRDSEQKVRIFSSSGDIAEDERISIVAMAQVTAGRDNIIQSAYESEGGSSGFEVFEKRSFSEIALKAADRAIKMLGAARAPGGRMPVVISSEAGGTMIHEAIGHGLEADLAQNGLSVYSGKLGEKVASPVITVIDDATLPGKRGSFSFDDEGVMSGRNVLVRDGELVGYMYDKATALIDGVESTGNGRRESYSCRPIPRMTNTFIAPGQTDPAEIVSSVDKGLLVRKMGGGQVNTVTGDFVFDVQEGYMIEGGQVGELVRGATLIGCGPEVLNSIDMVGSDLGFAIGTCGKDGQGAPVSDALPTLRIKEIVVGGEIRG
jgi:TldD protein